MIKNAKKVFIDGSAGTTGLRIRERLGTRQDIEIITLPDELRKDENARKKIINEADIVFLCLPDDAARQAVAMIENDNTIVIDTSTAHRTLEGWAYGFPELSDEFNNKIKNGKRIAVPGCHASGFIALVYPLIKAGVLEKYAELACYSITGYSGGGKKMIAEYEDEQKDKLLYSPRTYALTQQHKHLREMKEITGLSKEPIFVPIVDDFYSGMHVSIPLFASQIKGSVKDIEEVYAKTYKGPIVNFTKEFDESGMVSAAKLSFKDGMEIAVLGNDDRITLNARYDNLGKGASGAAVQCLNIILGADTTTGLDL
ncbi:MAG: N-acetyl-gamma-glutamyl-phosphate reductase [Clostridia bacterium]|nr:N-acetyl-gamma-glutamyl-phosphate reductase [Clostridia bacterium]MBQ7106197.1 N-acetyl-gamma-glutamyl-phosphate reductase [Clostridia bacterium]